MTQHCGLAVLEAGLTCQEYRCVGQVEALDEQVQGDLEQFIEVARGDRDLCELSQSVQFAGALAYLGFQPPVQGSQLVRHAVE